MPRTEIEPRGRSAGWWWLWLIIILIVLFFIWIFAWRPGYNTAGPQSTGSASRTVPAGAAGQGSSTARVPALVGKQLQLTGVTVARVVSERAFWAGQPGHEVLVVLEQPATAPLAPGQVVNVTGRVETVPSLQQASLQWGLNSADMRKLQTQQVYVDARRVEIKPPQ